MGHAKLSGTCVSHIVFLLHRWGGLHFMIGRCPHGTPNKTGDGYWTPFKLIALTCFVGFQEPNLKAKRTPSMRIRHIQSLSSTRRSISTMTAIKYWFYRHCRDDAYYRKLLTLLRGISRLLLGVRMFDWGLSTTTSWSTYIGRKKPLLEKAQAKKHGGSVKCKHCTMDRFSWTSSSNLCILQGESGIHQQSGVRIYDGDKKVRTYCLKNVNNSYFTSTCRVRDRTNYTVSVLTSPYSSIRHETETPVM